MMRWATSALVIGLFALRVEAQEHTNKKCEKAKTAEEQKEFQAKRGAEAKKNKAGGRSKAQAQERCAKTVLSVEAKIELVVKLEVTIEEKTQGNEEQYEKCAAAKKTCDKLEEEWKEFAAWCKDIEHALAEVEQFEKEVQELDALVDELDCIADALFDLGLYEEADEFEAAAEAVEDLLSDLMLELAVYHYACGEDEVGYAIVVWWIEADLDEFDD